VQPGSYATAFGNQKVVMVPKGDPRARPPAGWVDPTPAPIVSSLKKEQKIVVEAEEVYPLPTAVHKPHHHGKKSKKAADSKKQKVEIFRKKSLVTASPRPLLKSGAPSANAGSCLAKYNGAAVAAKASAYQANYKSRGVIYSQPRRQFGIGAKYADCSSFVTSILQDTGFDCLFAAGRYTAYMNQQIAKRGGWKQTAVVGDIVMWGSHTGLIVKVCGGGRYTMVAMGLHGAGLASCLTVSQLKSWGSGGWKGFWTPRP